MTLNECAKQIDQAARFGVIRAKDLRMISQTGNWVGDKAVTAISRMIVSVGRAATEQYD